ncbi:response regulator [Synechocystis sp. LKSZ1]|uniref:response regulator n=1 Tax=Synechocystis sp. LKSZ1 TaxID=3144951 RepID=UPI00336C1E5E
MQLSSSEISQSSQNLVHHLSRLQKSKFSGLVKVSATALPNSHRELTCFLAFQDGCLTLVERTIPSPSEFVHLIAQWLKVGYADSLMEYASRRTNATSVWELLDTIIGTRAFSWEDIERVATERMIILLEQIMPYSCAVAVEEETFFDMGYGSDRHGIDCSSILQKIAQRQQVWRQYLSAIPSLDAIPRLRSGVLGTIHHHPTRQHLQQWVDGRRSFMDIAEALHQDPLTLAPLYYRWTNERLLDFLQGEMAVQSQALPVVLSVDDSPIVQAMIRRSLCEDYEVISASSAMDALGVLNRREVSLILLDVTMPEIDGLEFCRTIRKLHKFKDTPVIMLTAKDGLIDRAKGHMAGTNRYLTKPINKDQLLSTVKEFV